MIRLRNFREALKLWPAWHFQRLHAATCRRFQKPDAASGVVVALTSYPARYDTLHLCLQSLFRQSAQPERFILAVSRDEVDASPLPAHIACLDGQLLDIVHDDGNTRSYKKIAPALMRYPGTTIVTCDDDKIYPPNWLKHLLRAAERTPDAIVCHRARVARALSDDTWAPYRTWPSCNYDTPSMATVPIGSGGVLYPPGALDAIATDRQLFLEIAPSSDDLWLKFAAWKRGTPACQVRRTPSKFNSIPMKAGHMSDTNVTGGNDAALHRLAGELGFTPDKVLG
ncbi:MAG: glycosyltransferase family A protein [Pseudomonadota bacterium]